MCLGITLLKRSAVSASTGGRWIIALGNIPLARCLPGGRLGRHLARPEGRLTSWRVTRPLSASSEACTAHPEAATKGAAGLAWPIQRLSRSGAGGTNRRARTKSPSGRESVEARS